MAPQTAQTVQQAAPAGPTDGFDERHFEAFKESGQFYLVRNVARLRGPEGADRPERTVVILGTGRSGTSMTAGVLLTLGVEFGDDIDGRLEDRAVNECLLAGLRSFLLWRVLTIRCKFRRLMRERIGQWKRWAFKSPYLTPYLFLLSGTVPNPVYVVPTRNVFETSFGLAQHVGGGWRTSFLAASLLQLILTVFTLTTRRPVLLFSYEQALKAPDRFVDVLADFLSIEADAVVRRRAAGYVDPSKGYRPLRRLNGYVDATMPFRMRGWIVDVTDPGKPVDFEVRDGETVLATGRADRLRPDVRAAGFHDTGRCGFDVRFDPPLDEEVLARLSIHVPAVGRTFWTNRGESR